MKIFQGPIDNFKGPRLQLLLVCLLLSMFVSQGFINNVKRTSQNSRCSHVCLNMAALKNHYEVLGVKKDASESEIKRAYRRLALKNHPDVSNDPDAADIFQGICEAYEVLSDSEQRATYDRKTNMGFGGSSYTRASSSSGAGAYSSSSPEDVAARAERRRRWEAENPTSDQIDDSFGSIFSDLLSGVGKAATVAV
ncbi:unnamed protein product, partial [Heterosigma akashiwo]